MRNLACISAEHVYLIHQFPLPVRNFALYKALPFLSLFLSLSHAWWLKVVRYPATLHLTKRYELVYFLIGQHSRYNRKLIVASPYWPFIADIVFITC